MYYKIINLLAIYSSNRILSSKRKFSFFFFFKIEQENNFTHIRLTIRSGITVNVDDK